MNNRVTQNASYMLLIQTNEEHLSEVHITKYVYNNFKTK